MMYTKILAAIHDARKNQDHARERRGWRLIRKTVKMSGRQWVKYRKHLQKL